MKKGMIKVVFRLVPILSVLAVVLSGLFLIWAKEIGTSQGKEMGEKVGLAVGTWEGVTKGTEEGMKEGKEEGNSAKDTKVIIQNEIKEVGKLEVLHAKVTIHNDSTKGKDSSQSYEVIEVFKGKLVFSVDLEETDFYTSDDGKTVFILLPDMSVQVEFDPDAEVLYEMQKFNPFTGAASGAQAIINTYAQLGKKAEEAIKNYDYLSDMAKEAAINQVQELAKAFSIEDLEYKVIFKRDLEQENE